MAADRESDVCLGEIVERIGEKGFGLLLLCLSLPSALPVPAPGYSTPFGLLIVLLAAQLIAGRASIWLPQRARMLSLNARMRDQMLSAASAVLGRFEHFICPRQRWVGSRAGRRFLGLLIALMGTLMILPIPLTNTFPAGVVFLIALGLTEEDGVVCLLGAVVAIFAVALYVGIVWFFIDLLTEFGWEEAYTRVETTIKDWLRALFGQETAPPGVE